MRRTLFKESPSHIKGAEGGGIACSVCGSVSGTNWVIPHNYRCEYYNIFIHHLANGRKFIPNYYIPMRK